MIGNIKSTSGIGDNVLKKVIHKGSETIMFSVLQETQYMYPFKSAVREIVSNSIDSVNEKNNFFRIMKGELKSSDLYIEKEGEEFADSKFDSSYYDEKWLSKSSEVVIRYIENDTKSRDRIQFIDRGVALGGSRLVNYFSLGFSTKRLSKSQLGNFGLGAKSLLSTGVDKYTVTSRYNGKEFSFDVYKDHVIPTIDKFNDNGSINPEYTFYNGYKCYYRNTNKKNKVTVEAEVKRHRKQDYFSGIQNQLGYIDNISFVVADNNNPEFGDANRDIKSSVIFENDAIIVGNRDYYAVPQILLKPGKDSNIRINYGPINFDELEMKKYNGNVGFILNINSVDVTPSRESVIWNTKTRDAIKSMFLKAQSTITDMITDKLSSVTTLPDHLYMLGSMKSRGASDAMSELYKVIDVSEIDVSYRNFNISDAALQLSGNEIKNNFIFTTTKVIGGYYNKKVEDSSYGSALTKDYISGLSKKSSSNIFIYIGDTKSKGIARYLKYLHDLSYIDNINFIYIKPSLYEEYNNKIKDAGGLELFLDKCYEKNNFKDVLMTEVIRYMTIKSSKVLFEEDIDRNKMLSLAKEEEENSKVGHSMSAAEKAKIAGKVAGRQHTYGKNTSQVYFNENSLIAMNAIIYDISNDTAVNLFNNRDVRSFPSDLNVIGFSKDNFKRFYKVKGIKVLAESLFTIKFGDLFFSRLGEFLLSSNTRIALINRYLDFDSSPGPFIDEWVDFIDSKYSRIGDNKASFNVAVNGIVDKNEKKRMNYLLKDNTDNKCEEWHCPSNK